MEVVASSCIDVIGEHPMSTMRDLNRGVLLTAYTTVSLLDMNDWRLAGRGHGGAWFFRSFAALNIGSRDFFCRPCKVAPFPGATRICVFSFHHCEQR